MKRFIISILLMAFSLISQAQTLRVNFQGSWKVTQTTVNGQEVTKRNFLYSFNKNGTYTNTVSVYINGKHKMTVNYVGKFKQTSKSRLSITQEQRQLIYPDTKNLNPTSIRIPMERNKWEAVNRTYYRTFKYDGKNIFLDGNKLNRL